MSQEALALECELHPTYISQIEGGLKSPTVRTLFRIVKALDLKASDILNTMEKNMQGQRRKADHGGRLGAIL